MHHDLARHAPDVRTIFDVGANVGQTARRFREVFPDATVYCFEPVQKTFDILTANVGGLGCRCFRMAMGSHTERRTMYVVHNSLISSLIEPPEYAGTEQVDVTTLDDWTATQGIESIDVLKIDAEGHDLEVLAGASRLLAQRRIRFLLIETGFDSTNRFVPLAAETDRLSSHGMQLMGLYHQTLDWGGAKRLLFADALFARND